jgi:hypothetical protein
MKTVTVGGVAAGASTGARLRRLDESAEIGVEPNVLTVGLTEPYVRLSTTLNGPERTAEIRQLQARSAPPRFTAYAHRGDRRGGR